MKRLLPTNVYSKFSECNVLSTQVSESTSSGQHLSGMPAKILFDHEEHSSEPEGMGCQFIFCAGLSLWLKQRWEKRVFGSFLPMKKEQITLGTQNIIISKFFLLIRANSTPSTVSSNYLRIKSIILLLCLLTACKETTQTPMVEEATKTKPAAFSLSGQPLYAKTPSKKLVEKYEKHKANYEANPSADNLIWYGRFKAYQGKYEEAIRIYSDGVKAFPKDARIYRHRGHRYISIRKFDKAIADFRKAEALIQGKENEVEPDGMPNAQNIPVSTLHGNIYYHLGLAYYLKHDFPNALTAYQKCLATSSNPDNIVSATHWLYMILRRMDQTEAAQKVLDKIELEMPVIENQAYHKACLLYKGLRDPKDLFADHGEAAASPSNDALAYGLGNWYFYNGNKEKAKKIFKTILERDSWSSFGYIAAEKDDLTLF